MTVCICWRMVFTFCSLWDLQQTLHGYRNEIHEGYDVSEIISVLQDVFGVATAAQIDIDKTKLIERDNDTSRWVLSLYIFNSLLF